jgi:hypothetical protein
VLAAAKGGSDGQNPPPLDASAAARLESVRAQIEKYYHTTSKCQQGCVDMAGLKDLIV